MERQRHKVSHLLDAVHYQPHPNRPEDTKERLEKALRRLADDNVIADWEYVTRTWSESYRPERRWLPVWLDALIEVRAPADVLQFYALELPAVTAPAALASALPGQITDERYSSDSVAALGKHFGLSQQAFAVELGVTRPMVTLIENGKRPVSKKLQKALEEWLARKLSV